MATDIREAAISDAAAISALNEDVQQLHADAHPWRFKQPSQSSFTASEVEALLADPTHFALLAFEGAVPVGYLIAEIARRPETPRHHAHDMIYIHQISVRPSARGKGAGRSLLDAAKAKGLAVGISTMALDVWAFNKVALAFFQSYGLVPFNIRLWNRAD